MFVQCMGHAKPAPTVLANIRSLPSVDTTVVLEQCDCFACFVTVGTGVAILPNVHLFMKRELRQPFKGLAAQRTLEGFPFDVGFLMCHELGGVGEVAIAMVAGEKRIPQDALLIFDWVAQFQVALFALGVTEDDVALDALQGELRC